MAKAKKKQKIRKPNKKEREKRSEKLNKRPDAKPRNEGDLRLAKNRRLVKNGWGLNPVMKRFELYHHGETVFWVDRSYLARWMKKRSLKRSDALISVYQNMCDGKGRIYDGYGER